MKNILILVVILTSIYSCGKGKKIIQNKNSKQNIELTIKNKNISLIEEKNINRSLELENKNYYFEIKKDNNMFLLYSRKVIYLASINDIKIFKSYIEYGNKYTNLIIDSIDIEIPSEIYSHNIINSIIDIFTGSSISIQVLYKKVDDFIPLEEKTIGKIYNHKPNFDILIVGNFSISPGNKDFEKLKKLQLQNIKELSKYTNSYYEKDLKGNEKYKSNWNSENTFNFWGIKHLQK